MITYQAAPPPSDVCEVAPPHHHHHPPPAFSSSPSTTYCSASCSSTHTQLEKGPLLCVPPPPAPLSAAHITSSYPGSCYGCSGFHPGSCRRRRWGGARSTEPTYTHLKSVIDVFELRLPQNAGKGKQTVVLLHWGGASESHGVDRGLRERK